MSYHEKSLPPGFRFHPTDEELILHYLKKKVGSIPCPVSIIAEVDIYKFDPWDLPAKASFGEKEWYFFSPRDRKYPNGARPNRAAVSGYWKATGTDKLIMAPTSGKNENIGVKKALVFYKGKPPKGLKTGWIMHEYRLSESPNIRKNKPKDASMRIIFYASFPTAEPALTHRTRNMLGMSAVHGQLDDWVLCRIYKKSHALPTNGQQEEEHSTVEEDAMKEESKLLNFHKSTSFSDLLASADFSLLSRFLLDNPSDLTDPQLSLPIPNLNQHSSNSYYALEDPVVPVAAMEGQLKRQRAMVAPGMDDGSVQQQPSKRFNNTNSTFSNITNHQLDLSQYPWLGSQTLYNQQMLLNSNLQFQ
ncbi:hypothetical protein ACLOJK_025077 [Asimina triloba]